MDSDTRAKVLDGMLDPLSRCLTPEVARRILDLRADASAQRRVDELAARCNDGLLSDDEREEYETYVLTGNLIAILQAKARRLVAGQTAA
jgi:hypothetical protein